MHKKPVISICIPTYNREQLIGDCLDSVVSQINDNNLSLIEIIISDNASTDNTKKIVETYQQKYSNISYYRNDSNLGLIRNIIKVTTYAYWEYLWLLADDDCLSSFSIGYILEIIKDGNPNNIFHEPFFSENIHVSVQKSQNLYKSFLWIDDYIDYLDKSQKKYKDLISYFSFYSAAIVRTDYWRKSLSSIDEVSLNSNYFPHELPLYHDLKDKKIVVPDSTLVIGRLLNESYPWSTVLIRDLKTVMNYIEKQNALETFPARKRVKKICVQGWSRTILLGILLRKLGVDYKKNPLLKKLYFFYKKFVQG